jgi:hypothetical protein
MIKNNQCENREDLFTGEEIPNDDNSLHTDFIHFEIGEPGKKINYCYYKPSFINYVQANRPLVFNLQNLLEPSSRTFFGPQILNNPRLTPNEIIEQLGYDSVSGEKIVQWIAPEGAMVERDLNEERQIPFNPSEDDFVSVDEDRELNNIRSGMDGTTREEMIAAGLDPDRTVVENTPDSQIGQRPPTNRHIMFEPIPFIGNDFAATPPQTPPSDSRNTRRRLEGGKRKKTTRKKKTRSKRKTKTRKNRTKKNKNKK